MKVKSEKPPSLVVPITIRIRNSAEANVKFLARLRKAASLLLSQMSEEPKINVIDRCNGRLYSPIIWSLGLATERRFTKAKIQPEGQTTREHLDFAAAEKTRKVHLRQGSREQSGILSECCWTWRDHAEFRLTALSSHRSCQLCMSTGSSGRHGKTLGRAALQYGWPRAGDRWRRVVVCCGRRQIDRHPETMSPLVWPGMGAELAGSRVGPDLDRSRRSSLSKE